jgi:DNA invertase Pin-like site-specific DNA recombinase
MAWELAYGPIPPGLHVLHRCDNPPCCNPTHLFLGTNNDNIADRVKKNRSAKGAFHWTAYRQDRIARGERKGNAKLTEADVVEIRRLRAMGVYQTEIAKMFNISRGAVYAIQEGKNWKHIPIKPS